MLLAIYFTVGGNLTTLQCIVVAYGVGLYRMVWIDNQAVNKFQIATVCIKAEHIQ